jgi:hypothetical protein
MSFFAEQFTATSLRGRLEMTCRTATQIFRARRKKLELSYGSHIEPRTYNLAFYDESAPACTNAT